jgi:hypothetical protein
MIGGLNLIRHLKNMQTLINHRLLLTRLYDFTGTGADGFLIPFIGFFYQHQGLTGTRIGLLGTVTAITSLRS